MAHFIGGVRGSRGTVTRLGTKNSGMEAWARGWNVGAAVFIYARPETGDDIVRVTIDNGSNGGNGLAWKWYYYCKRCDKVGEVVGHGQPVCPFVAH